MNYFTRISKYKNVGLIFLIALVFISCSTDEKLAPPQKAKAVWFNVPERFSFRSPEGELVVHPFFDLVPFASQKEMAINFVATNTVGSHYAYDFDLLSGQRVFRNAYCTQEDVWGKYDQDIEYPPYTEGVVPRLLNQSGEVQKIIVFGNKKYYQETINDFGVSNRVRVIGGLMERYCQQDPCVENMDWMSRLVLVAVDTKDFLYKNITTIEQLKKSEFMKWDYVLAFLQNERGRNSTREGERGAYKITGEIAADKVLEFVVKNGHLFKFDEMTSMRRSCHKLYDYIWKSVVKIRKVTKSNNRFGRFFGKFYKKYRDEYLTCSNYVRPASINSNINRHWFFAYLNAFMHLDRMNYMYVCSGRVWLKNQRIRHDQMLYDSVDNYQKCSSDQLDDGFRMAILQMGNLQRAGSPFYRFVEYDEGVGGSHGKLYSWVKSTGKSISCVEKDVQINRKGANYIFPADIYWKKFHIKSDRSKRYKNIIR